MNVCVNKTFKKNGTTRPILQGFCDDGKYKTLFDIGATKGGGSNSLNRRRSAERRLFGNVFDGHDGQRPRYGNLNPMASVGGDPNAEGYGALGCNALKETLTHKPHPTAAARAHTRTHSHTRTLARLYFPLCNTTGKSYFILKDHVRKRCTVTSRDSFVSEAVLGTLDHCAHVLLHTTVQLGGGSSLRSFLLDLDGLVALAPTSVVKLPK